MTDVYLISCTKAKQRYTCPAEQMYAPSELFRGSLAYALKQTGNDRSRIFILSAKYGLLPLDREIETYDETLTGKPWTEIKAWGSDVYSGLKERFDLKKTNFIMLAGRAYTDPLRAYLPNITEPLQGMPMGVRIQWLHGQLGQSNFIPKPSKPSPAPAVTKPVGSVPTWEDLMGQISAPIEVPTITKHGEPRLWFRVEPAGSGVSISAAREHSPASKAAPRLILKTEYERLAPMYPRWRSGAADRVEIAQVSQNSSYLFGLMHHFSKPVADASDDTLPLHWSQEPKPDSSPSRMLVDAKLLRDPEHLSKIPQDQPGWYRWWAPLPALKMLLDSPWLEGRCLGSLLPHLTEGQGRLKEHYGIYVGIAVNESLRSRLDWHVNQRHSRNAVSSGTLSTFRQSISSLISLDESDEGGTNRILDMMKVEYQAVAHPIKSREAASLIESIEKKLLAEGVYPINIKDNPHEVNAPFREQLRTLRHQAKANALK